MQRPGGNWSVKCVLWQVLARGSSLGWAEHAVVIAGTRRRWSGRRSPRPTTQSPVESVAVWDPDIRGIVLTAATRIPLDSRGGSITNDSVLPQLKVHPYKVIICDWMGDGAQGRLVPKLAFNRDNQQLKLFV